MILARLFGIKLRTLDNKNVYPDWERISDKIHVYELAVAEACEALVRGDRELAEHLHGIAIREIPDFEDHRREFRRIVRHAARGMCGYGSEYMWWHFGD